MTPETDSRAQEKECVSGVFKRYPQDDAIGTEVLTTKPIAQQNTVKRNKRSQSASIEEASKVSF